MSGTQEIGTCGPRESCGKYTIRHLVSTTTAAMSRKSAGLRVPGVRILPLAQVKEARGRLVAAQFGAPLPFVPRRCFIIMDVPNRKIRGEHAHRKLQQFLVCVRGRVTVLV